MAAPPSVAVELCEQENPPRIPVHLVNYNPAVTLKDIAVKLRLQGPGPRSARLLSPAPATNRTLRASQQGNLWTCTLPELKVYAAIVINGARL